MAHPPRTLQFKRKTPPGNTTLFRALAKTSVDDLQTVLAEFLKAILAAEDMLTAAVDGKVSKQMKDADGDAIQMLNIFIHDVKITMMSYDIGSKRVTLHSSIGREYQDWC